MLPIALFVAVPLLCGAIPALPNSFAPLTQQQNRIMQIVDFSPSADDALSKYGDSDGSATFAFEPSEQKPFVLKGRRLMKDLSPPAIVPKLTADAKIIAPNAEEEKRQIRQKEQPKARFLQMTHSVVPKRSDAMGAKQTKRAERLWDSNGGDALTNPASFFMYGADLDKIAAPSCHLMGCTGPLANDGDIALEGRTGPGAGGMRQCHQTFVPMNGCWERTAGRDSYPVGMVCTICCDCSAQLATEMRRSRGWTNGYREGQ